MLCSMSETFYIGELTLNKAEVVVPDISETQRKAQSFTRVCVMNMRAHSCANRAKGARGRLYHLITYFVN